MTLSIETLYHIRFSERERKIKNALWQVLCRDFLQQFVQPQDTVVDLGAGFCEFLNNINCAKKIAVDIDPYVKNFAKKDVQVVIDNVTDLNKIASDSVDVVFVSELFEHLHNKDELIRALGEILRILKSQGTLLIICPNIRYLNAHYWDFIDHTLALNHYGLQEALQLLNFKVDKIYPRFLPYTIKARIPKSILLLKLYLRLPFLWKIFGKQMLVTAHKK